MKPRKALMNSRKAKSPTVRRGARTSRLIGRSLAAVAAGGFAVIVQAYLTLPDVRVLRTTNPSTTAFMDLRDREARAIRKPPKHVQRWMAYARISPSLSRAVLVAEDDAFWQHEGVDFEQIQESLEADWARGRFVRGASTITQQLAKNLYLSPSRSPLRKFRELIIARRLEVELKKARILEIYLNVIEWGDGVYGADAAARAYFATSASSVGAAQAALLAAAIVNPRVLSPSHPSPRLLRRQQLILRRMGAVSPPPPEPTSSSPHEATSPIRADPGNPSPAPDQVPPETAAPSPLAPSQLGNGAKSSRL
jgi:monofunctional biosynthetic peptidoglycan transglycosylase